MSYTQTFYHIVLRTHRSIPAIAEEYERELYSYMLGFINNIGGRLYRIGGMPDHVHLFVSLPATLAMSKFVQELKVSTSKWLKANPHFPIFDGWSKEYAGFSYSLRDRDKIVGYIAMDISYTTLHCSCVATTLRLSAGMVLIALCAFSLSEAVRGSMLFCKHLPSEVLQSRRKFLWLHHPKRGVDLFEQLGIMYTLCVSQLDGQALHADGFIGKNGVES